MRHREKIERQKKMVHKGKKKQQDVTVGKQSVGKEARKNKKKALGPKQKRMMSVEEGSSKGVSEEPMFVVCRRPMLPPLSRFAGAGREVVRLT